MGEEEQAKEIANRLQSAVGNVSEFVNHVVIVATVRNDDGTVEMFSNFRGDTLGCESAVISWLERRKNERLFDFLVERGMISRNDEEL